MAVAGNLAIRYYLEAPGSAESNDYGSGTGKVPGCLTAFCVYSAQKCIGIVAAVAQWKVESMPLAIACEGEVRGIIGFGRLRYRAIGFGNRKQSADESVQRCGVVQRTHRVVAYIEAVVTKPLAYVVAEA